MDLVFRNDSAGHVLIRTEHTRTSITVKFFGDNDGRILVGSWKDGRGRMEVVAEGGPQARLVSATVSGRSEELGPPETLYRANPEVAPEEVESIQTAAPGWTVTVTRTIRRGEESTEHVRRVRYIPRQEIIEVHPCVMGLLTESGAYVPPPPSGDGEDDAVNGGDSPAVCPGPEDESPTVLPEGLGDRFPELLPEEDEQAPIEDGDSEQAPIEDDQGDQAPIGGDDENSSDIGDD